MCRGFWTLNKTGNRIVREFVSHFKELEWLGRILAQTLKILLKYCLSVMCVYTNAFIRLLIKETPIQLLRVKRSEKLKLLNCVQLFATAWTVAPQAPLKMGILQARILEWVAMPSSRGSSQLRDQTQISCIVGRFFTNWATGEDLLIKERHQYNSWELKKKSLLKMKKVGWRYE